MNEINEIFKQCKDIVADKNYTHALKWKEEDSKRVLIGIIPNYIPREIIHAANGLAVGIISIAKTSDILKKSDVSTAIEPCGMLTGLFEIIRNGAYKIFDGFVLPSHCQAIENHYEMNELKKNCDFIKYIQYPQYFQTIISDIINQYSARNILDEINKLNGITVTTEKVNQSIEMYKKNNYLTQELYLIRQKEPDKITENDLYSTVLAGLLIPVDEHNKILCQLIDLLLNGNKLHTVSFFEVPAGPYC